MINIKHFSLGGWGGAVWGWWWGGRWGGGGAPYRLDDVEQTFACLRLSGEDCFSVVIGNYLIILNLTF